MKSKKHRELPEFEIIQAAIEGDAEAINQILSYQLSKVTPKQSIRYFPIFSHLLIVSARENIRMNLGEFIMWLMNI